MNTVYIACAITGFALLFIGLLIDDFLDSVDLGLEWISVPIIAAAVGSFGIAGWVSGSAGAAASISAIIALLIAILFGIAAAWFSSRVQDGTTDATPQGKDLMGTEGRVVTPVSGGTGEVLIRLGGQVRKLTAVCDEDLELGTKTITIEVESPTRVRVTREDKFWLPTTESTT